MFMTIILTGKIFQMDFVSDTAHEYSN